MKNMIIKGAREGNLKNISLEIPRGNFIVLTGVSGSGKSTLAIDTIYQECQRQYLEAISPFLCRYGNEYLHRAENDI